MRGPPQTPEAACVSEAQLGQSTLGEKNNREVKIIFLKNEDSKRIKEWFKVHERKVQQSMQWDSVVCAKK